MSSIPVYETTMPGFASLEYVRLFCQHSGILQLLCWCLLQSSCSIIGQENVEANRHDKELDVGCDHLQGWRRQSLRILAEITNPFGAVLDMELCERDRAAKMWKLDWQSCKRRSST